MPATPRYTFRQELPVLIEVGKDTVLTCPVYRDGALAVPASATVAVIGPAGENYAPAATVVGGVAEATLLGATTSGKEPGGGWRVEWTLAGLAGASDEVVFRSSCYLVRYRLYPTVTDEDIARRVPALRTTFEGRPTTAANYQGAIDEADTAIQRKLLENHRRPWLIVDPWALRECWLCLSLFFIYDALVGVTPDGDPYSERADHFYRAFEASWSKAQVHLDWDEDGSAEEGKTTAAKAPVWTC
jgi:hypothetical protein